MMEPDASKPVGISASETTLLAVLLVMALGCLVVLTWSVANGADGLLSLLNL